jgi:hypothetical protein
MLISDFRDRSLTTALTTTLGTRWRLVTDRVMGGLSQGDATLVERADRPCLALTGDVSLANNGGFIQLNAELAPAGSDFDARRFAGIRLQVIGNDESYGVHLKTAAMAYPWQSYRASFVAGPHWVEVRLPFSDFEPHRIERPLELERLRRLGIVAIGRAFHADLCIAEIGFY